MRQWILLVMFAAALALASCDGKSLAGDSSATTPSSRPASASASAPASRPATQGATTSPSPQAQRARRVADLDAMVVAAFKARRYGDAETSLRQILALEPNSDITWYNLACAQARQGRSKAAMLCMTKAVDLGYASLRWAANDGDLASLRDNADFQKLLARSDEIQRARAERIEAQLKKEYGADYICQIDHDRKLVFATNIDAATLDEVKTLLTAHAQGLWRDLFDHNFEQYVSVIVLSAKDATRLPPAVGGFYNRQTQSLLARQIGMTLVHEFTHALHGADQDALGQQHPIWILEGLATLYEMSEVRDGHVVPLPNARLNQAQEVAKGKQFIPWKELLAMDQPQYMHKAVAAYAESRCLMLYLYEKGLLKKWYDAFTASYEHDRTGGDALVQVLGKPLDEAQADWLTWLAAQPPVAVRVSKAYIGVQTAPMNDGLKVVRVLDGSGAQQAGLEANDEILKVDGLRMIDPERLVSFIAQQPVGKKVQVEFRRNGERQTADVTLAAVPPAWLEPSSRPASRPARGPASRPSSRASTQPTSGPASPAAAGTDK